MLDEVKDRVRDDVIRTRATELSRQRAAATRTESAKQRASKRRSSRVASSAREQHCVVHGTLNSASLVVRAIGINQLFPRAID